MEEHDEDEGPSKSSRKRASTDLQELGEALIALPEAEFEALPLPETLRDAVVLARRITQHGGLYRQKQYIGKLMRKIDAEPIRAALRSRQDRHRVDTLLFRRQEQWRDRLIAEEAGALERFVAEYPFAERTRLLELIRQVRHERAVKGPPGAARELFRYVREVMTAARATHPTPGTG